MRKTASGFRVGTDRSIVHIAFRWLYCLVDGRAETGVWFSIFALASDAALEIGERGRVPSNA